jgi:hypothetical protein
VKRNEWIIFGLAVLFLVVLMWWLLPKDSKDKLVNFGSNNNTSVPLGSDKSKTGFVYAGKDDGAVKNEAGYVISWDQATDVLAVNVNNKTKKYSIVAGSTKVMVVKSQNKEQSKDLYLLDKTKQLLHWQHAFCPNDAVTIFVGANNNVTTVMNTGYRACGFKEKLK